MDSANAAGDVLDDGQSISGVVSCGCRWVHDRDIADDAGHEVYFCPLHASAPDLLAALEATERQLRQWHISTKPASRVDVRVQEALDTARTAIRKAKGE